MTDITLVMIVRNEQNNIKRCLDSVIGSASSIMIVDTKSTDKTIDTIKGWSALHPNIQTKIEQVEFLDFSQARNCALNLAKKNFLADGYFLLLDADMCLSASVANQKLTADAYHIIQKNNGLQYSNIRLVRKSVKMEYKGVTHEYLHVDNRKNVGIQILDGVWINDHDDGGHKKDKFVRDEKLLVQALSENQELEDRYYFYLAQTYWCMENFEKAIYYYHLSATHPDSWSEQIYFSHFMTGECYYRLNQEDKMLESMLLAISSNNKRAEPYWRIMQCFNEKKLFHLTLAFKPIVEANIDHQLDKVNDFLFQNMDILQFRVPLEIAVAEYYSGDKALYKSLMYALNQKCKESHMNISQDIKDAIHHNLQFI